MDYLIHEYGLHTELDGSKGSKLKINFSGCDGNGSETATVLLCDTDLPWLQDHCEG